MLVFVTGATGFIGSAAIRHLIARGHRVLGLTRSDEGATALKAAGASSVRGTLADLDTLANNAREADAVLHLGFEHDFDRFAEVCAQDKAAIDRMCGALEGSGRAFLTSSGTAILPAGRIGSEDEALPVRPEFPRVSEQTTLSYASRGVAAGSLRFAPSVHGREKQGLVTYLIYVAQQKGVSAYVGDGSQRWAAVQREDAAELCALAVEKAEPGARWHAVGEEGVALKTIAEAIGRGLGVPTKSLPQEDAVAHFGPFLGHFAGGDHPASSRLTQQRLGWKPTGVGLLEELEAAFKR